MRFGAFVRRIMGLAISHKGPGRSPTLAGGMAVAWARSVPNIFRWSTGFSIGCELVLATFCKFEVLPGTHCGGRLWKHDNTKYFSLVQSFLNKV